MYRVTLSTSLLLAIGAGVSAQITSDEEAVLDALDPTRTITLMRTLSEDIVDNRSGAGAGTAVAGSRDEKALADFIEKEMTGLGLDVTRDAFPVRLYDYGEVTLTANGDRIAAITLHSSTGTWGTRDDIPYTRGNADAGRVLEVEIVDAGMGLAADYERTGDVRGKAVLVRRRLWPSNTVTEAAERGALAIVFYDYPGENPDDTLKQDSIQYHDPIPAVAIAARDAARLAGTTIRLENRVDVGYGFSENVIGRREGSVFPDEYVAVSAHHDRWHEGAQDDSIGVAVMLEIGRALLASGPPRRTLVLMSFGAEEAGGIATQSDWLTGSYAFVKQHPEVTSRLAYAFNVDGAGWTAETGHLFATLDNLPFQKKLVADLGLEDRIRIHEGVTNWVDAWSLGAIGGGAVSYLLWFAGHPVYENEGSYSRFYHTQADLYRPHDYQNLDIDLDLGTLGVLRMDRAGALPVALTEVAAWTSRVLETDAATVPDVSFDAALAAAGNFRREAERIEGAMSRVSGADDVRLLNRALMNCRHELVPWLLSGSSSGAVLKTSPYASDMEALGRALEAAEHGDAAAAARALEDVATMGLANRLSRGSFLRERLYNYGPANWGNDFEQDARAVSAEIHAVYEKLGRGGSAAEAAGEIRALESQARGHLEEALFIVAGKLRDASARLRAVPLP